MRFSGWSPLLVLAVALSIVGLFFVEHGSPRTVYALVAVAALTSLGVAIHLAGTIRWTLRARKAVLLGHGLFWIAFAAVSGLALEDYSASTFLALVAGACSAVAAVLLSRGERR
jgi:hypothetical protein